MPTLHFTKNNSNQIIGLNAKYKSIKSLDTSIGENLDDFGFGDEFLSITPEAQSVGKKKPNT